VEFFLYLLKSVKPEFFNSATTIDEDNSMFFHKRLEAANKKRD
jgi:hypothetical protein